MRSIIFFVFILLCEIPAFSQTVTWDSIRPTVAGVNIGVTDFNLRNYIGTSNQDTMHALVVFLPGTTRAPVDYRYVMGQCALLGYHVIGLMYKTDPAINPICRTTDDPTCHWRARMETIDGVDRHPMVSVNADHSILNRLEKLLQYLILHKPAGGWEQFYSSGEIQWDKIIVTGHSQGGALAAIIGKEFPVKRVVMFSMMDFLNSGRIPNWVDNTAGSEKYFALLHPKDDLVPFSFAQVGWERLGMTQYGSMANVDCDSYPYNNSHLLYTNYEPASGDYHNGSVLDSEIQNETVYKNSLKEAVRYLFKK